MPSALAEKHQILIYIVSGFIQPGLHPMIYRNQDENTNHYTTDAGQKSILI
jgi:hypothetical protein